MAIHLSEFIDCCGLSILYSFRSTDCDEDGLEGVSDYDSTDEVLESLDRAIIGMSPEKGDVRGYTNRGGALVTLNSSQRQFWEPHLLKRNFKIIAEDIFNPNSEALITIYLINFGWNEENC